MNSHNRDTVIPLAALPSAPVRRVAFFGTPDMAVPVLVALADAGLDIALVVTRHDKKRGRGSALVPSPVKLAALERGIPVSHQVDDVLIEHERHPIDLGIVVAFGVLIKRPILEAIPMVNLHVSLLPRWRGAAPIERAILAGDAVTGVCLMQLEEGLDTGGVVDRRQMVIASDTTVDDVKTRLMVEGVDMLLDHLRTGQFAVRPQDGEVTYASKIEPHERHIDWSKSAEEISRQIRIGDAWTMFRGKRLKIHSARVDTGVDIGVDSNVDTDDAVGMLEVTRDAVTVHCGRGRLVLGLVQAEGRPRVPADDWVRGARVQSYECFDRE